MWPFFSSTTLAENHNPTSKAKQDTSPRDKEEVPSAIQRELLLEMFILYSCNSCYLVES